MVIVEDQNIWAYGNTNKFLERIKKNPEFKYRVTIHMLTDSIDYRRYSNIWIYWLTYAESFVGLSDFYDLFWAIIEYESDLWGVTFKLPIWHYVNSDTVISNLHGKIFPAISLLMRHFCMFYDGKQHPG